MAFEVLDKPRAVRELNDGKDHRFLFIPEAPIFVERRAVKSGDSFEEMKSHLGGSGVGVVEDRGGVCKVVNGMLVVSYTPEQIVVPLSDEFEKALRTYGVAFVEFLKQD